MILHPAKDETLGLELAERRGRKGVLVKRVMQGGLIEKTYPGRLRTGMHLLRAGNEDLQFASLDEVKTCIKAIISPPATNPLPPAMPPSTRDLTEAKSHNAEGKEEDEEKQKEGKGEEEEEEEEQEEEEEEEEDNDEDDDDDEEEEEEDDEDASSSSSEDGSTNSAPSSVAENNEAVSSVASAGPPQPPKVTTLGLRFRAAPSKNGLGLELCPKRGGVGVIVRTILPGSEAARDGRLRKGAQLLMVGQHDVSTSDLASVISLLRDGMKPENRPLQTRWRIAPSRSLSPETGTRVFRPRNRKLAKKRWKMAYQFALHGTRAKSAVEMTAASRAAQEARRRAATRRHAADTAGLALDRGMRHAARSLWARESRRIRFEAAETIAAGVLHDSASRARDKLLKAQREAEEQDRLRLAIQAAAQQSADDARRRAEEEERKEHAAREAARQAARRYEDSVRAERLSEKKRRIDERKRAEAAIAQRKRRQETSVETLLSWNRKKARLPVGSPFASPGAKLGSIWSSMSEEEQKQFRSSARRLGL
eukprot:g1587.t1